MSEEKKNLRDPKEFKEQALKHKINYWHINTCQFCEYKCKFLFTGPNRDTVSYDNGCDCVTYATIPRTSSFMEVCSHYNRQTNQKTIDEMDTFWHFNDQEEKKD